MVFLVILQISTCKNVATKHTIPQNTEIFGFLGSKYQIIPRKNVVYYIENIKLKKNAIYCKEPSTVQIKMLRMTLSSENNLVRKIVKF